MGAGTPGFAGPEHPRGPGRPPAPAQLARRRWRGPGPDAGRHRRLLGRGRRAGPPRAGLPDGVGVDRPGRRRPPGHRWQRGRGGGVPRFSGFLQWSLPFGAVSAVNWLALVADRRMHEFSLTREQLGQIALNGQTQRRRQPQGHLPGPHDPRRLPRCPDDLDAPVPVRLRRPVRRVDGASWSPTATTPRMHPIRPVTSTRWAPPCGAGPAGTSSTTPPPWRPGTPPPPCGSGPSCAPPTWTWPSSTTASPSWPWCGWRRSGSAGGARAAAFVEDGTGHRPRRRPAPQHRRRPAVGRSAARFRAHPRGLRAAPGRGRRPPGPPQRGTPARGGRGEQRGRADRRHPAAHRRSGLKGTRRLSSGGRPGASADRGVRPAGGRPGRPGRPG